jgi:uncharacterized protein DUF4440
MKAWTILATCLSCTLLGLGIRSEFLGASNDANEALRSAIVENEQRELDCLKTGDMRLFAGLIADDAVFVNPGGMAGKAEVVKNASEVRLKSYSMEDIRFVSISPESGMITYKLTENGVAHGKEFSAQVYASALWVQRDGKWVSLFSQETPAR